jgi:CRISPR-associated protein Cas2
MHFVVAYDIVKDRRREKVMNTLKNFGLRVQYSVFECELTMGKLDELRERLRTLIDPRRDRVHIYPLCDACFFRSESLGLEGKDLTGGL